MADEFTPEASVDFETLAAAATGNGGAAHVNGSAPPPLQTQAIPQSPRTAAPHGGDPFAQLEAVSRDLPLIYRELGDINALIARTQVMVLLGIGISLAFALLIWRVSHGNAAG